MDIYEDIYDYDKGRLECTLCNVLIPENINCIDEHIEGRNHFSAYKDRLAKRNSINRLEDCDANFYCRLCDQYFDYLKDHVDTDTHQSEMDDILELIDGEYINLPSHANDRPMARCTLCHCNLCFRYHDLVIHINGNRHSLNHKEALKSKNGVFGDENTDENLWCKICGENFDADDLFEHIDDCSHIDALQAIKELIEDEDIDINDYLTVEGEDKAFCNACNVPVPCTENNLYEHINGYRHSS